MKSIIATIYSTFETRLVSQHGDDDMAQKNRLLAGPRGEKLVLGFRRVA
jgi:hypothetical protein